MKILARSKGSALIVLLAPLIIVFIIGLGFMDTTEQQINVGIHITEQSNLTDRYLESFNTTENNIIMYDTQQQCINSISEDATVLCTVFSEDFQMRDGAKNELTFYVDESRLNLVDRLISSVSTSIGTESSEISEELTEQLLKIVSVTNEEVQSSLAKIITSRAEIKSATTQSESATKEIADVDIKKETINTGTITTKLSELDDEFSELRSNAQDVVDAYETIAPITELEEDMTDLNTTLQNSTGIQNIEDMQDALLKVSLSITKLNKKLDSASEMQTKVKGNLDELTDAITTTSQNIDDVKINLEEIMQEINSFELKSATSISSPVTTNIESVSLTTNRLTYSFSYLLTLAILFIGLMLSSTLVYTEKDSKAFFRNFTTPTTQKYFIFVNYLTALIIILLQTIVILAIAHFALSVPILTNTIVISIILFVGITLFIMLGLLIGSLSATSEAVTMSNIVIGSVFLFLSNLILPLETLSPLISKIASFNPYVIVSESIRKAMLFNANITQIYPEIIMLTSYIAIIVTLMIIINQIGFKHYIATRRHRKNLLVTEPENLILELNEEVKVIKNIPELIQTLKKMSEDDYADLTKKDNQITYWLKNNLKKKMLARRIKTKKLPKVIEILEQHQKKKDKKTKKHKHK